MLGRPKILVVGSFMMDLTVFAPRRYFRERAYSGFDVSGPDALG